jgi:hypothetical protein
MAGGATLAHTYIPKSVSDTGGMQSWLNWSHKTKNDGEMSLEQFGKERDALDKKRNKTQPFSKNNMLKEGAGFPHPSYKNPLYDHPGIPVKYSLDLIYGDKYLNGNEKINASSPFRNADPNGSGVISQGDLTRGAMRAGFGLGAGYLAGKTLGTIFAAPTAVTQTLSASGALAGMLKNTGVF